jgi:dihydrofolate reductase
MATAASKTRKIVVNIATSADGYVARSDGNLEWLTSRPAPKGFYGMEEFMRSIDAKVLGRRTFEVSVRLGAKFDHHYVFSRQPPPVAVPAGVEFINGGVRSFANRLKHQKGKNIWLMGGAEIIASFLDAGAIDEFIVSIIPVFIGEGIPLIAPRHRHVPLQLHSVRHFPDGVVQVHYGVRKTA